MMHRILPLLALLVGCSDYGLQGRKDRDATDTGAFFLPDTDGDSDTRDACRDLSLDTWVPADEACRSEPAFGTLDAVVEWESTSFGEYPEYAHVLMAPAVGPLRDGDGDGDVDASDPASVVVVMDDDGADGPAAHGVLRIVDGRDGTVQLTVSRGEWEDLQVYPYRYSNVALGDVDGDGAPEIVLVVTVVRGPAGGGGAGDTGAPDDGGGGGGGGGGEDTDIVVRPGLPDGEPPPDGASGEAGACRVAAYSPAGALVWLADDAAIACGGHAPALADLDGDGGVEVIVGSTVVDGSTGALRWAGTGGAGRPPGFSEAGWMSFAADLDGDGPQEVVTGSTIYEADGAVRCSTGEDDGFPAAADLDGDGVGEVVVVSNGWLRVFDASCALRMATPLGAAGIGGPPALGDLDGDGLPEIGVAAADRYAAFEADGTVIWTAPVTDTSSSTTGSTFYDFEGDGVLEVLYADERALWVFDGRTGEVRVQDDTHSSRTLHEYPVVVDVDGDGRAEIVVPNGGTHDDADAIGLYVLGSASDSWPANRAVWNQHAYAVTNVEDDLSIPSSPLANWPTYNTFRSGVIDPLRGATAPDAVPRAEVCTVECDSGTWRAYVRVGNEGLATLRGSVPVTLYAGAQAIETQWTRGLVASEGVSETLHFEVAVEFVEDMRVQVDDDGTGGDRVNECLETNNAMALVGCE
jgi:hypothetical protein